MTASGQIAYGCFRARHGKQTSDICIADADGTKERLLGDPRQGFNIAPVWSPDGTTIAYLCGWDHAATTNGRLLFPARDEVELSMDRFDRNSGGELCVVDAAGGRPQTLTQTGKHVNAATWSPDGTQIAFSVAPGVVSVGGVATAGAPGIYVLAVAGESAPRQLTSGTDDMPAWSPGGDEIAYVTSTGNLRVVNVSSGAQRSLDGGGVGAQASIDVGPAWSRDGRWIAYTKYPIGSERETWVIEPSGAHRRRLATTNRFEDTIALSFIPQWTPDSRAVIALDISLAGDASAQARLVRMLVDTPTEPVKQPLTPRESVAKAWGALSPAVSPDGHWIAYVDDRWGGQSHLHRVYVAAMDGTHNPPVAFPRRANDPKWIDDLDPSWRPSPDAS